MDHSSVVYVWYKRGYVCDGKDINLLYSIYPTFTIEKDKLKDKMI